MDLKSINWKSEKDRWAFIKAHEDQVRERNIAQYYEWYLDIAFYMGHQNLDFDRQFKKIRESPRPSWRVRVISNLLLPMARQLVSQLARIEPVWDVLPATRDMRDIDIAHLSRDVCHHYWRELKVFYKYLKSLFYTATTGNGFLKTGWDPDLGADTNISTNFDDVDAFFSALGIDVPKQSNKRSPIGDVFVDYLSPFNIMFQPGAQDIDSSLYSIESNIKDIYEVTDRFGKKKAGHITAEETSQSALRYLEGIENLSGAISEVPTISSHRKDKVIEYTVHVKPHNQLKDGLRFTMAQGRDLHKPQPFPYKHGMLPYVHLPEVTIPGKLFATSTLSQNRPNQVIMNRFKSQGVEYANMMLKGKWLAARESQVDPITDAPGQVIRYKWPFKPEQARLIAFPRSIFELMMVLKQDMQDVASNHDVTQGRSAASVRSGTLAETLKEGDLSILGPVQLLHDIALADLGKMLLQNVAQYVQEPRLISITAGNRLTATREFVGSELVGDTTTYGANYFNVITTATGRAPWSRVAQREMVRTLVEGGFLRAGEHDQLVHKAVGLENAEVIFEQAEQARSKQAQENKQLDQGIEITPHREDSHDIHLEIMNQHNENYERWNSLSDEAKAAHNKHRAEHEMLKARSEALPQILLRRAVAELVGELGVANVGQTAGNEGNNGSQGNRGRGNRGQENRRI